MNPATVERLARAWEGDWGSPRHILAVAGTTGCWPATVYRAVALGYLRRTEVAHYVPTADMAREYARILTLRRGG